MRAVLQDIRHGLRILAKSPGFTLVAALTLALGIGANTTIFTMLKSMILRPLPGVRAAEQLVVVVQRTVEGHPWTFSYLDYEDLRDRNEVFENLAACAPIPLSVRYGEKAERTWGEVMTGNNFEMLGVHPALGRLLTPNDDRTPGAHPVAVVSYRFWSTRMGADPKVLGKTLFIGTLPFTVIGVTDPAYHGSTVGLTLDVFVPTMMVREVQPSWDFLNHRDSDWLLVQGRLKSGTSLVQARASLHVLGAQMLKEFPNREVREKAELLPLSRSPFGAQSLLLPILTVVMVVVGIVLLIACSNVANLMLSRAAGRVREIGIRQALGAGRGRLIRQLLTESVLVSVLGGAASVALSFWANQHFANLKIPAPYPVVLDANFDGGVFAFTLLLAVFSGVLFGLAPALHATKTDLVYALKEETGSRKFTRSRLRSSLLVVQVALSLVLLIGTVLVLRSEGYAAKIDVGFDPDNVVVSVMDLAASGYSPDAGRAFYRRLLEHVRALPGVSSASLSGSLPLQVIGGPSTNVDVEGYTPQRNEDMVFYYTRISPGYFADMRIRTIAGRDFDERDDKNSALTAIVNEQFAHRFWSGQNPLEHRIQINNEWRRVVGVVHNVKVETLTEEPTSYIYVPLEQDYMGEMIVQARAASAGAAPGVLGAIQKTIHEMDPNLPVFNSRTLRQHMDFALASYALTSELLGVAGLQALVLAGIGIYGVIAFLVTQRTREIGIRMALGAKASDVVRVLLWQGMRLAFLGAAIGLALAAAATRAMGTLLYGVSARDPLTFVGVTVFLLVVAALACYLPALRALRVDPIVALRYE
jgi:putative ABC transport system permease protein